jgi:hypothetical protein
VEPFAVWDYEQLQVSADVSDGQARREGKRNKQIDGLESLDSDRRQKQRELLKNIEKLTEGKGGLSAVLLLPQALCLAEKDMSSKLDMLFRKNLYTIAINLIQGQQADAASTAEVMRKYGDHLYGKQVGLDQMHVVQGQTDRWKGEK